MSSFPPPSRYFWGDAPDEAEYYATQGVKNSQSYFTTPAGTRIFTQSFTPISGPTKATVFMTHGYGSDTGWLFQKIAISFSSWGYAVHCADLLGHGRSDGIRCYLGDLNAVADASLSYFASVRRSEEYKELPAFLFGESLGGLVTMLIYLRSEPGMWTGVMFSAPLFVIPDDMKPSKIRLFVFGLLFGLADTWEVMPDNKMVGKAIKDPEKLKVIASNPRRYTGRPRLGTMREIARMCEYVQANFSKVTAPFIVVHGTEDGVTSPKGSEMLYEKAASDDKEIILYEGMFHSLIQGEPDENSARVLRDFRVWIDKRVERYGDQVDGR
nr:caffeoyl shikimate esterase 1 [Leucojum aestivum]